MNYGILLYISITMLQIQRVPVYISYIHTSALAKTERGFFLALQISFLFFHLIRLDQIPYLELEPVLEAHSTLASLAHFLDISLNVLERF
jgi:hypothetical protein